MDREKIVPGVWGAIVGAIAINTIGFGWGGWVTGGTAQEMAEEMAENAVVNRSVPICVTQSNYDSKKDQKFKELKELDTWKRSDFVKKQGWATMSGEKNPDQEVSNRCAEMLMQSGQ